MPWPTPQDYNEAIQNPGHAFADPELATGSPELTSLGLPRPITGNFASVYRLRCGARDWAVRCFWREYADMRERYEAISRHLAGAGLQYTVGFEYQSRGIRVGGQWFPIVKMEWVAGELLGQYVERHLADSEALDRLAERWLAMCAALERASSAHGDLQHGNVMVVNGELKLVDYDAMYVPALAGRGSHEIGHQNYQHPRRTGRDFGPSMDRFSSWVIYTSIRALQTDPHLWKTLRGGDECLILRKSDFLNAAASPALRAIAASSNADVAAHAARLSAFAGAELSRVTSLQTGAVRTRSAEVGRPQRRTARVHRLRAGTVPGATAGALTASALPAWLADHVQPVTREPASFSVPRLETRIVLLATPLGLVTLLLVTALSVVSIFPLVTLTSACLLFGAVAVCVSEYRAQTAVREMRTLLRDERRELQALRSIERAVDGYEARLMQAQSQLAREISAANAERSKLQEREVREIHEADSVLQDTLRTCAEREKALNERQRTELDRTLNELQTCHVRGRLRDHSLRSAYIPALGWSLKMRLWAAGVRCAADLTAEKMRELQWCGEESLLALAGWRVDAERDARRDVPKSLDVRTSNRIIAPFERTRSDVESERTRARDGKALLETAVRERYARRRAPLDSRIERAQKRCKDVCAELECLIDEVRRPEALHTRRLADIQERLQPYEGIRLSRYVAHLLSRKERV